MYLRQNWIVLRQMLSNLRLLFLMLCGVLFISGCAWKATQWIKKKIDVSIDIDYINDDNEAVDLITFEKIEEKIL